MITEQDLQAAIAECQGERDPNARTCIKLAAFYILQDHLFSQSPENGDFAKDSTAEPLRGYSYAPAPGIDYDGESEFARQISGRDPAQVWPLVEELVETLRVVNPRLYNAFMGRVKE